MHYVNSVRIDGHSIAYVELISNSPLDSYISLKLADTITINAPYSSSKKYLKFVYDKGFKKIRSTIVPKLVEGDGKSKRLVEYHYDQRNKKLKLVFNKSYYSVFKSFAKIVKEQPRLMEQISHHGKIDFGRNRIGDYILANHCGVGLFIKCTGSDGSDSLIAMEPNRENIAVYNDLLTYSASGGLDWQDNTIFDGVSREAQEELNITITPNDLELITFGYDTAYHYFQFGFLYETKMKYLEICARAKGARDKKEYIKLVEIPYKSTNIKAAIRKIVEKGLWEPAALYGLCILYERLLKTDCMDCNDFESKLNDFKKEIATGLLAHDFDHKYFGNLTIAST